MTAQIYKTDCLPEKEQKKELFIRHLGEILKEKRTEAVLTAMDIHNFKLVNEIWGMRNGSRLLSIIVEMCIRDRFFSIAFKLVVQVLCHRALSPKPALCQKIGVTSYFIQG